MIRFIAAIDSKRGIANDHGIPWQGKIPGDVAYFRLKTLHKNVLMGYGMYKELTMPLTDRKNYVASSKAQDLSAGFEIVHDAVSFLKNNKNIWVIGGAGLYASTIHLAHELYLTRIDADFNCTKFFPTFENDFELVKVSDPITENNITYRFEVWKRKS